MHPSCLVVLDMIFMIIWYLWLYVDFLDQLIYNKLIFFCVTPEKSRFFFRFFALHLLFSKFPWRLLRKWLRLAPVGADTQFLLSEYEHGAILFCWTLIVSPKKIGSSLSRSFQGSMMSSPTFPAFQGIFGYLFVAPRSGFAATVVQRFAEAFCNSYSWSPRTRSSRFWKVS